MLRETLERFEASPDHFHGLALRNLAHWARQTPRKPAEAVQVIRGDWGDVTLGLTQSYGVCFAVLNMANAYVPGGAYLEGAPAQEENMYRRTDCHFSITDEEYNAASSSLLGFFQTVRRRTDGRSKRVPSD